MVTWLTLRHTDNQEPFLLHHLISSHLVPLWDAFLLKTQCSNHHILYKLILLILHKCLKLYNEWALKHVCCRDPPSSRQPSAGLSTSCCYGSCQRRSAIVPMDSCQEPGWGLHSGLTVALHSRISQELELSGPLPVGICLSSSKIKKVRESSAANSLDL